MTIMQIIVDFGFMLSATKDIIRAKKSKLKVSLVIGNTLYAQFVLSGAVIVLTIIIVTIMDMLDGYLWFALLSIIPVILSIFLFEYVFKAYEQMGKITTRFVAMKVISLVLTILFVKSDNNIILIPLFDIIGMIVSIIMVNFQMKKLGVKCNFVFNGIRVLWKTISGSFRYFISNFISTIFGLVSTITIGIVLGKADVAYWTLSMQLLAGVHALYNPIINSIYPEMIKTKNLKLVHNVLRIYIPLILVGCVLVWFLSDEVVKIAFTEKYMTSATLFKYLIPVLVASFISFLYGWPCLGAIEKVGLHMITEVVGIVIQLLGLAILVLTHNFQLINIVYIRCIAEIVICISRVIIVYRFKKSFVMDNNFKESYEENV
jgi:PST family polysaccharide transporter